MVIEAVQINTSIQEKEIDQGQLPKDKGSFSLLINILTTFFYIFAFSEVALKEFHNQFVEVSWTQLGTPVY